MERISCPSCGKPNPADNKFCDFCLSDIHPKDQVEGPAIPPFAEDNLEGLGGHENDSGVPDWLSELQQTTQSENEDPVNNVMDEGQQSDPVSGRTDEEPGEKDDATADELPVSPFLPNQEMDESEAVPHWLNDALIEQDPEENLEDESLAELPDLGVGSEISEEGLPSTQFSEETLGELESAGPLAGLKGILSAEAGAARAKKPKAYSSNLKISTSQREHIELLTGLMEEEGQPKPVTGRRVISQQNIMRWVIALVLLLAVTWPLIFSSQQMPFPIYDEGSSEVNRLINQLPDNPRVLVGFDFEPGLAAELDAAAAPVIDHLMERGSLLTLISTSPTGPILAERFMGSSQAGQAYINGLDYINLGYLPGGAAGLASFINNLAGTILFSIDGVPLWEADGGSNLPVLSGVDQVTDFDMVVVLVDDPESARMWIEQLGPKLSDSLELTSLVLVTSAQLEPIVRPYYDGIPQLVNGLVVGLRGGAAYTRLVDGAGSISQYWDAFGWGTFVAAMLILVGGLAYYVVPEITRTATGQEKVEP